MVDVPGSAAVEPACSSKLLAASLELEADAVVLPFVVEAEPDSAVQLQTMQETRTRVRRAIGEPYRPSHDNGVTSAGACEAGGRPPFWLGRVSRLVAKCVGGSLRQRAATVLDSDRLAQDEDEGRVPRARTTYIEEPRVVGVRFRLTHRRNFAWGVASHVA